MDWMSSLILALGIEQRRQQKQAERLADETGLHCREISAASAEVSSVLEDLFLGCGLSVEETALTDAQELIPLYPFAVVLSVQGHIGKAQEDFLRDHLARSEVRYNLHQFLVLAIERGGLYPEWDRLTALGHEQCGEVWHTMIEAICRLRRPEAMQRIVDAFGAILYHFHFLDDPSDTPIKLCYDRIISSLNAYAESDQQQPYLHAVMLLQMELAAFCGGEASDYEPCSEKTAIDMEGAVGDCFWVCKHGEPSFHRRFAVRRCAAPGKQPDLIWELHFSAPPTVFFSE